MKDFLNPKVCSQVSPDCGLFIEEKKPTFFDAGTILIIFFSGLFVACKVFFPELGRYVGGIIAIFSVVMYFIFPKLSAGWFVVGIASLDDLMLGVVLALLPFLLFYKIIYYFRVNFTVLIISFILALLMLINLYSGGDLLNNITRFLSISIPLFFLVGFKGMSGKGQLFGVSIVYYILIFGQIIFLSREDANRMSIFNASENIAFIIFSILMYYVFLLSESAWARLSSVLAFFFFVLMTDSRTGMLFCLVIVAWLLMRNVGIKFILLALCFFVFVLFLSVDLLGELGDEYLRYFSIAKFFLSGDMNLASLAVVDVRGEVYQEGLTVWGRNIYFGSGAYPSAVLQDMVGNNGMHEFHNFIIDLLVQYGLVGFVLVLFNYSLVLRRAICAVDPQMRRDIIFLFLFYFLFAMFQPLIFNYQPTLFLFFCVLCLSKNFGRNN